MNTFNNNFIYSGNVTLKVKDIKSKKIIETRHIKNAGTKNLFKFLCDCLTGTFIANNRPRYLDASASKYSFSQEVVGLVAGFSSSLYYRSILTNPNIAKEENEVKLDSQEIKILENWHVKYSATLLRNQLDAEAQMNGITSLALFNSPDMNDISSSLLAWINLTTENGELDPINIDTNQAILIEWDLSFDNYIKNIMQ